TDIRGIGFVIADKIAQRIGIATDSAERIRAGVVYQLRQSEDRGHCFLATRQLVSDLSVTLSLTEDELIPKLAECLQSLNRSGVIVSERFTDESGEPTTAHYLQDLIVAEAAVADKLA